ncbi:protein ORF57 [Cyprinid herpesvirus 3]|uniref:Protein ORF57 n=1 Tax=Cyprinid herpesvirus 3 TaxID=180230 RepID=A3QMM5_CYHV3|nr:unnamed protein product [Cyprinid herpesvirus 3]ABC55188.1 hypothetical protein [Cyprinid herpesvirus 3]ABG42884.1 protein ORF57 [Cyprinid herpesvirus 3]AJP55546.1 protein ORF57 [Cyprinid herpesvirus 3]AOO32463.1 protein ORF57 [Cyprinid herpesvirus 3]AOO32622.1 protein ORF57 [Cyprinid herpesvirus 3]
MAARDIAMNQRGAAGDGGEDEESTFDNSCEDLPDFVEACLTEENRKRYNIQDGDFPPYRVAVHLSQKAFTAWDEVDYAALADCLCEGTHLQAVHTHKLYVLACGALLWGKGAWMDPQMMSRLYVHDVVKIKLLERVVYGFMMALQKALRIQKQGCRMVGLEDPEKVEDMKNFVLHKGFNHHYAFCDHHWQHWALGRSFEGELPDVVVKEMISDGLACTLERAGPFSTLADWLESFSLRAYPQPMHKQIRQHLMEAFNNAQDVDFPMFKSSLKFLASMHCLYKTPRWSFMPSAVNTTLDTFDDCACDVHVLRHVEGQNSCDCLCCRRQGCHDEDCRPTAALDAAELRGEGMSDDDDIESEEEALGAVKLDVGRMKQKRMQKAMRYASAAAAADAADGQKMYSVKEPKVVAVKAQLVGVGDTDAPSSSTAAKDCADGKCQGPCNCERPPGPPTDYDKRVKAKKIRKPKNLPKTKS